MPKRRIHYLIVRHGLYLGDMAAFAGDEKEWTFDWSSKERHPIIYATRKEADTAIGKMPEWLRAGCEVVPRESP
jgi:hypothetical protein